MATTTTKAKTTAAKSTTAKPVAAKKPAAAKKPVAAAAKPAPKSVETVEKAVEETVKAGQEAAEKAVKASAETLKENFEKAFTTTREKFEETMKRFTDYSSMGRENYDAFVASGTALTKGLQAVNAEIAAISKRNMEDGIAAMKSLSGAKTAKEFFELQSDLARTSWDTMVADSNKIGELLSEYAKDAMEPISAQVKKTVEQFTQPLAA